MRIPFIKQLRITENLPQVCELESQLTAFTDGIDSFAEDVGSV